MKSPLSVGLLVVALLASLPGAAIGAATGTAASDDNLDRQLAQLEPLAFHPNLLPIILANADMIGLSEAQVAGLRAWRNRYARPMIAAMKQVARARIDFQTAALAPTTSAEDLRAYQDRIFDLQRIVLNYKLTCRENILRTFTRENWENLYLVLADQGNEIPLPAYGEVIASLPTAGRRPPTPGR